MRCCLIICDGMADIPAGYPGGMTPLEAAHTPAMDNLAAIGRCGSLTTIPPGLYPGSETGILTILGYTPEVIPSGRAFLELLGSQIDFPVDDRTVAARYRIDAPDIGIDDLRPEFPGVSFHPLSHSAGLAIFPAGDVPPEPNPHITFWSHSRKHSLPAFPPRRLSTPRPSAAMVGAVPLVKGIAAATGMEMILPPGATGDTATDYAAKGLATAEALGRYDIVVLHIEACDTASHARDYRAKTEAIENIDTFIVAPLLRLAMQENDIAVALLPDHPSLCSSGLHSDHPVPAVIYIPGLTPDAVTRFTEKEASRGSLHDLNELYRLYEYI